jgi:hypothetical protein
MVDVRPPNFFPFTEGGRVTGIRLANFANDSDEPLGPHKEWISQFFLPMMAKNPGHRVRLIGMASRNGDATYNKGLSGRRIRKVEGLFGGKVNIVERNPGGEVPAAEDGVKDGNRDGRWRAVLLRWEGVSLPLPIPPGPQPAKFKKVVIKTQPGVWLIISVDTFGVPIKFLQAGRIAVTLLNDKGEQWVISGFGGGLGVGAEFGADAAKGVIRIIRDTLKNIGFKAADLPNLVGGLDDISIPSATIGGVFRGTNIVSNFTIHDIVRNGMMLVISGSLGIGIASGEEGLIVFGNAAVGRNAPTIFPWGVYSSLTTLKAGADIGGVLYSITDFKMKGILEKEVLDLSS